MLVLESTNFGVVTIIFFSVTVFYLIFLFDVCFIPYLIHAQRKDFTLLHNPTYKETFGVSKVIKQL